MFHIVFDARGAEGLNTAMDLDNSLDGETVFLQDDYSLGPIHDIYSEEGLTARKNWWRGIKNDEKASDVLSDGEILKPILQRMQEEEFDEIWIWLAPNAKDISGYFWLIGQLKEFSGRIFVVSLNNLPFIGEKGNVFYPTSLSEIPAREFVKAKKLARAVTPAEYETDPDEWIRLASENKNVRILEGGKKLSQKEEDYFDRTLLNLLQPTFQKISRAVQSFLSKTPEKINDSFITWRYHQMAASGLIEQQGETVKLPTAVVNC